MERIVEKKSTTRKSELFTSCKPDNHYIFEHEEYDWDDIVNAFIAGGLYSDKHPVNPWKRFDSKGKWLNDVVELCTYEVCNIEDYDATIIKGNELISIMAVEPKAYTHYRFFDYPH